MASRAIIATGRGTPSNWRAALRRSALRAGELGGACALFGLMLFLGLALASYHQTDPSISTAAGGEVANWMGAPGAWAAERMLFAFGLPSLLVLPLIYLEARQLWALSDAADGDEALPSPRWWRLFGMLLLAMALLGTVLALVFDTPGGSLPASLGGVAGLLGAKAIAAFAALLPPAARGWTTFGLALATLAGGALLAGRVLQLEWRALLRMPAFFRRPHRDPGGAPALSPRRERKAARRAAAEDAPALPERKPPEIADTRAPPKQAQLTAKSRQTDLFAAFELPSLDLLADPPPQPPNKLDKLALERNARLLETVLDDFNVKGEIAAVRTGPVVTMYELEPAPGVKASRVIGLAEDIARNMSAISARVSSIPGRTVMGIELPNADRQMVAFKELAACDAFVTSKALLPIILGKDISGEPIVADLAAMPHLLVAGTTGSGKSVGLNTILLSLLYRLTPDELRLILIDPKVLELKSYDDIPHLLSPVVTEPAKSVRALKWAVEEMERRYRQMSSIGVRNLSGFNDKVRTAAAKGKPLGRRIQIGFDPDSGEELFEEQQLDYQPLPQIVVIVDELADLMVTIGKEIEVLIQRLSQKSRAAGIHLIMATQRPSVDVITGVIKANLPTRISFAVTSRIDSRTILGEQGAEQLLGKGDMLYKPNTAPVMRVHGPFVSDEEVESVADHWRGQGSPAYVDSVTEEPEDGGFGFDDLDATASDAPEERKYRQVCQIVFESQKASASWIQRQMGVGYNTAAKWIERMEADGFVGPSNHVGRREIYRDKDGSPL
ncbi:DNA translocase FtsK 4TM domain-containing protein [Novosphingobium sp. Gsoil 351]|uniref:FtsK/SpoIIIE family DNA translocase n=1 Tax=Novosphingobium sp. Gsoil 351 TaxID=2675225 RepID=UPI0012B49519|nr:DNA translocase FtsK 4TM domain-containing protein [Novosphingobium sp. Gsoil 351]QGN54986.1 DNA translocase FtsK [Novosphingobium sp. Gsoil 351]